ncbi:S41 family peptidase [Saccharicrinis sp. FJH2]|uniref:S41 family peptidase n=1 Tax=Saccharicrinis sp. FJH65 TaxID=3344659 RepID=UPI0035F24E06
MKKRNIAIAAVLVVVVAFFGFNSDKRNFEIAKNLDIYYSLFRELDLFYVDSIEPEKLIKTSIDDMLEQLDPYTVYIPEKEMADFKFMTTGEYGGIGSLISQRDGYVMISDPYEGMPAEKTGLKAGDLIMEINGQKMKGKKVSDVSDMLKGTPGTSFHITVKRPGENKPLEFDITREKITINPVPYYDILKDDIGYIRLTNFTDKASDETEKALLDLKARGAKAIVLDLRSNPGGILDEAVNIVNLFVPRGEEIVSTRGKVDDWDKVYKTTNDPVDPDIPLAVLVNSNSASASEIVAGAIQDLDRGIIVGSRTFGKGLVQTTRPLSYKGQLKVTTAKYYIPSGRCIQALDYSHRNPDGSVGRVPDSLISTFKTKNGRTVKDGGGILPDVKSEFDRPGNVTIELIRDYIIFDYATQYANNHKSIPSPENFTFSDADYNNFITYVKSKDFDYETKSHEQLEKLKSTVEAEGYNKISQEEIDKLDSLLKPDLDKDLNVFKKEIKDLIAQEIVKRYYYQKGEAKVALKDDVILDKAIETIQNGKDYRKILAIAE